MNLAQEAKVKFKMYEGLNNDDPSIMHIIAVQYLEVLAVQGQSSPHGNCMDSNQIRDMNAKLESKSYMLKV